MAGELELDLMLDCLLRWSGDGRIDEITTNFLRLSEGFKDE